ncbi:hypothetical protein INN71_02230 [Nocardioides sp. ChNu-153]|uniref:hypothetical protein n=1 Tax=unclassified Nocardioides TaxID=2615069 RepID=UPI00240674F8|nr:MULTISPECIES: hypothetical protein [unclassified Nocardioides]MDF9716816.1 hypothetical protein [Nocardioides sp. ChNu-99]MDN7120202.1 hypothetical protein [Nocardioides sp. ChNu-153]
MTTDHHPDRRNDVFAAFNVLFILAASTLPRLFDLPDWSFLPVVALAVVVYAVLAFALLRYLGRNRTS